VDGKIIDKNGASNGRIIEAQGIVMPRITGG
jgi:hypothetical protein